MRFCDVGIPKDVHHATHCSTSQHDKGCGFWQFVLEVQHVRRTIQGKLFGRRRSRDRETTLLEREPNDTTY